MRSAIFVAAVQVALAVPAVFAQDFPDCANSCLVGGLSKFGCPSTDLKCVCNNKPFIEYANTCIRTSCPAESIPLAILAAYKLCATYGVTLETTLPVETMTPTTSALYETTTPTTTPETTPTSEVPYPTTTEVPYPTTTVAGTGTLTLTGNSTTPTIAPPPTNSEGAAIKNIASFGAMAMAIAGLFAL